MPTGERLAEFPKNSSDFFKTHWAFLFYIVGSSHLREKFKFYDFRNVKHEIYRFNFLKFGKFWKSKFKDDIYEANYEKIVNSPEQEIKKMISFCDLDWEPDCLNFYKNKVIY